MVARTPGTRLTKSGCPLTRPYTGFNGYAKATTPGLEALRDIILYLNPQLRHLGSYAKRDMKGKPGLPSVHATGRACDIGFTAKSHIEPVLKWLVEHADTLGVEMIADYHLKPWGRAWRCDRNRWKVYDKKTIYGAPGGQWIHLEISPTHTSRDVMDAAILLSLIHI